MGSPVTTVEHQHLGRTQKRPGELPGLVVLVGRGEVWGSVAHAYDCLSHRSSFPLDQRWPVQVIDVGSGANHERRLHPGMESAMVGERASRPRRELKGRL